MYFVTLFFPCAVKAAAAIAPMSCLRVVRTEQFCNSLIEQFHIAFALQSGGLCSFYYLAAAAAMFCFKNFMPSNAMDSGVGAMSRQIDAAADSSPREKPKLSMVSQPS